MTESGPVCAQQALKLQYQECFRARLAGEAKLPGIIGSLARLGVLRQTLVRWAVEAGCTESYARSLLSKILCALGLRQRRPGAGRKPSREVLELVAELRERYGDRYLKTLRAACREGKAQARDLPLQSSVQTRTAVNLPCLSSYEAGSDFAASRVSQGLIVVPQLAAYSRTL
jgi:hypothetical protein